MTGSLDELTLRQLIASHLKNRHGYTTLDTVDPVSLKALGHIQARCRCSMGCVTGATAPSADEGGASDP